MQMTTCVSKDSDTGKKALEGAPIRFGDEEGNLVEGSYTAELQGEMVYLAIEGSSTTNQDAVLEAA